MVQLMEETQNNQLRYMKPVVNNGRYLPYQLVNAGFLNHQPHQETITKNAQGGTYHFPKAHLRLPQRPGFVLLQSLW